MASYANVKGILSAGRAKIEAVERWTVAALARDEAGFECEPTAEIACKWCALGAVRSVANGDPRDRMTAEDLLLRALPEEYEVEGGEPEPVADYNDNHADHAGVLGLFDRAIANA